MSEAKTKMTFSVSAQRVDTHGSLARCKDADITLGTDLSGRPDAFNPAELLHDNVKKYGTVFNTVAPGTQLRGVLKRAN